jgi:hypothetical protein
MMILRLIIDKGARTPSLSGASCCSERCPEESCSPRSAGARGPASAPDRAALRIWDVSPQALALVTGVLLRRDEIESLLEETGDRDHAGAREDALREALVQRCGTPCALAEAVEHLLDGQTQALRAAVERCPMMQIADYWSRARERISGEELAALLWRLACDPRPQLEPLVSRVSGHLCVRALQLLREARGAAREQPDAGSGAEPSGASARRPAAERGSTEAQPRGIA